MGNFWISNCLLNKGRISLKHWKRFWHFLHFKLINNRFAANKNCCKYIYIYIYISSVRSFFFNNVCALNHLLFWGCTDENSKLGFNFKYFSQIIEKIPLTSCFSSPLKENVLFYIFCYYHGVKRLIDTDISLHYWQHLSTTIKSSWT